MMNIKDSFPFLICILFILIALASTDRTGGITEAINSTIKSMPPAEKPRFMGIGFTFQLPNGSTYLSGEEKLFGGQCIYLDGNHQYAGLNHPFDGFYLRFSRNPFNLLKLAYNNREIEISSIDDMGLWCCPRPPNNKIEQALFSTDTIIAWYLEDPSSSEGETTIGIFLGNRVDRYSSLKVWAESVNPNHNGSEKISQPIILNLSTNEVTQGLFETFEVIPSNLRGGDPYTVRWRISPPGIVKISGLGFDSNEVLPNSGERNLIAPDYYGWGEDHEYIISFYPNLCAPAPYPSSLRGDKERKTKFHLKTGPGDESGGNGTGGGTLRSFRFIENCAGFSTCTERIITATSESEARRRKPLNCVWTLYKGVSPLNEYKYHRICNSSIICKNIEICATSSIEASEIIEELKELRDEKNCDWNEGECE